MENGRRQGGGGRRGEERGQRLAIPHISHNALQVHHSAPSVGDLFVICFGGRGVRITPGVDDRTRGNPGHAFL